MKTSTKKRMDGKVGCEVCSRRNSWWYIKEIFFIEELRNLPNIISISNMHFLKSFKSRDFSQDHLKHCTEPSSKLAVIVWRPCFHAEMVSLRTPDASFLFLFPTFCKISYPNRGIYRVYGSLKYVNLFSCCDCICLRWL